jgi:hypothetical protein
MPITPPMLAGALDDGRKAVKWATDYFIKAHTSQNEFYGQVGQGDADHAYWGRPEDMTMARPAYKIDTSRPGKLTSCSFFPTSKSQLSLAKSTACAKCPLQSNLRQLHFEHNSKRLSFHSSYFQRLYSMSLHLLTCCRTLKTVYFLHCTENCILHSQGSDLAGETAAALAAASIVFKNVDSTYSNNLLTSARQLFDFANNYRGKYSDSITDARNFYA